MGGPGTNYLFGAGGNDVIYGGAGTNYITDPGTNTTIYGGPGSNTIVITATTGNGVVINGGGSDTYIVYLGSLAGPVTIHNSHPGANDNLTVNGAAGNNAITVSGNQVTAGTQKESYGTAFVVDARGYLITATLFSLRSSRTSGR